MTPTQAQACLISQLAQEALPYQFQATLTFRGRLDEGLLMQTLQAIVDRHEILRSHFVRRKGTWYQVVDPRLSVDVPTVDVGAAADTAAAVGALSQDFFGQRIDIGVAPLVRWKLLRLGDDHHVLLHVEHHCSMRVVVERVPRRARGALPRGRRCRAPRGVHAPSAPGAVRRLRRVAGAIAGSALGAAQLAYWKRQLADLPPPLTLPSDRPRPRQQSFRGARVVVSLPQDLVERLRSVCREHEATLFMTMLSAFSPSCSIATPDRTTSSWAAASSTVGSRPSRI